MMKMEKDFDDYMKSIMCQRGLPYLHQEFTSSSIQVGDDDLHLDIRATPGATATVINIPGTAVYGIFYAEFCLALAKTGLNVITFDHRGHGRSTGERGHYTVASLVEDVRHVISFAIDQFDLPVYLVGASQGGIVALYTAAADARVSGIACKNVADLSARETENIARYPLLTRAVKPALRILARRFPHWQVPLSTYLDLEREKMKVHGDLKTFIEQDPWALKHISLAALASLATTPPAVPIEKITTPVMVIQSENDELFPLDYVRFIFDRLAGPKRLEIIPGHHGHLLFSEHASLAAPLVADWFHSLTGGKHMASVVSNVSYITVN